MAGQEVSLFIISFVTLDAENEETSREISGLEDRLLVSRIHKWWGGDLEVPLVPPTKFSHGVG